MKFKGKLKAITFKNDRASVLLEDARIFTDAQIWEDYTDLKLVKTGKYKKGEVWMSTFRNSAPAAYEACEEVAKMGQGVEVEVKVVENKGFFNIAGIGLKMPEKDVNEDLIPPHFPEEEPSSKQRPPDSPEAEIEEMVEKETRVDDTPVPSTVVDMPDKETLIIRQTCIKAVGAMVSMSLTTREDIVVIAKRLEKYILGGE